MTTQTLPVVSANPVLMPPSVGNSQIDAALLRGGLRFCQSVPTGPDVWGGLAPALVKADAPSAGQDVLRLLPTGTAHILSKTLNPHARHGHNEQTLSFGLDGVPAGFRFVTKYDCTCQRGRDGCRHAEAVDLLANTPDLALKPPYAPQTGIATLLQEGGAVDYAYLLAGHVCNNCKRKNTSFHARLIQGPAHFEYSADFCAACGFRWRVSA